MLAPGSRRSNGTDGLLLVDAYRSAFSLHLPVRAFSDARSFSFRSSCFLRSSEAGSSALSASSSRCRSLNSFCSVRMSCVLVAISCKSQGLACGSE